MLNFPQPADDRFSIDYSLGAVSGHVGLDTLSIGTPPITVMQQAFGLATDSTADFSTTSCDGVFVSHLPPLPSCHLCSLHAVRDKFQCTEGHIREKLDASGHSIPAYMQACWL